jgi:TRAP-type mannitol/chloroaromatic compound transport system substrate-binding protein
MNRRDFLQTMATRTAAATALGLAAGCGAAQVGAPVPESEAIAQDSGLPEIQWQMATSWPVALDTIYGGAEVFAQRVAAMTSGKFQITPRAAGELAPGLQVLDVVQEGAVPIGHTASYYYVGKTPTTAFGTALPFGLTARQQNAWLYDGGGLELMQQFYADRFNVIQFPAGNTGVQMGGWFNKEIASIADLEGLKMRIPGLGGQVMDRLGVNVQVLPGGEIFQALQTGAIDAAEWVGPYDDEKLGFHRAAQFYYYPGWWEPGPTLEVQINLDEWNNLPEEYQEIMKTAAHEANAIMMARYDAKNPAALAKLTSEEDITLLPFPDDVMAAAEEASFELYDEFAAQDTDFGSILTEWVAFREAIEQWHGYAELAMLGYLAQG